jgi:hypothetical protein
LTTGGSHPPPPRHRLTSYSQASGSGYVLAEEETGDGTVGYGGALHSHYNISLLVSSIDIPVGLGGLFQGLALIDDRLYLSRIKTLSEKDEILGALRC